MDTHPGQFVIDAAGASCSSVNRLVVVSMYPCQTTVVIGAFSSNRREIHPSGGSSRPVTNCGTQRLPGMVMLSSTSR